MTIQETFDIPYQPTDPDTYTPAIGLVGCGDITKVHVEAYRAAGYDVVAFCDIEEAIARERRDDSYPDADVYTDAQDIFDRSDIDVVDIATHPGPRVALIEDAIMSGKHVLSQKPFVLDLEVGEHLVSLADEHDVTLAVNQNARWAPHFSYIREAVAADCIGTPISIDCSVHWDHDWIANTSFNDIGHAILYDFAIHWFDFVATLTPDAVVESVSASVRRSPIQQSAPPLLGAARIDFEECQASLTFDGGARYGERDHTHVSGSKGTLESAGPNLQEQNVAVHTEGGSWEPDLEGSWFPTGMHGAMGELLAAIEDGREPAHSARNNLRSLRLCFAAVESADCEKPVNPVDVTALSGS